MNSKNKSRSFITKTAIYVTIFVVCILLLLWGSIIFLFSIFFERYQLTMVNSIASDIPEYSLNIDANLDKIAYENEVCILRVRDDVIVGDYNTKMIGCALNDEDERILEMMSNFIDSGEDRYQYRFINHSEKTSAVLLSVKNNNDYIYIYANLEDTSVVTTLFNNQLLYLTIAAIIISIIVSYFLARKITEPIIIFSNKAKFLGSNKDIHFEKYGIKEVDELADSLNIAAKEIGKTNEFKRDLLANVSHDLKTPLTMIKAYAEMIKDFSYKDKKKLDEHIDIIVDETNRLTLLVNDILDMSKLEENKDKLHLEKYDLKEEIKNIINKYQNVKETEKYEFIINAPAKVIIKADKSKINQVIYNLVSNAVNYTGDDKKVTINVKKKTLGYLIEIVDTGKGIKKEDINNIWDKYYKTEKKHQRNVVSSGVGLSIVKEILLLHKYEYGVDTSSKGTTFYFIVK